MKSVKNFLYERMSSDNSSSNGTKASQTVIAASVTPTSTSAGSPLPSPGTATTAALKQQQQQQLPTQEKASAGFFSTKSQKGRRKISLPWFRQNSVSVPHAALSRQHTIDSPGSFRFFRQTSNNLQVGSLEVTWVVLDYNGAPGTNELTVTKGQQVEVIETSCTGEPDFCLVRLNPQTDDGAAQEGLVPISILKPSPGSQKTNNSRKESETLQEQGNNRNKAESFTSSSTKRRGFSGRKWLPPPLRKYSQGKVDKPSVEKSLIKKGSEKNLRLSEKQNEQEEELNTSNSVQNTSQADYEAEEEVAFELPPPMKPIQEPCVITNGPPVYKDLKDNTSSLSNTLSFKKMEGNAPVDLSEIEQIVKEKTEQHEVKSKFLKPLDISSDNARELEPSYSNDKSNDNNDENNSEVNDAEAAQKKRMCALRELVSTEELYIQDLSEIVNGYIQEIRNSSAEIPLPEDLKGRKERIVFGNIEAIYEWHRDYFFNALQRCLSMPSELGPMIKRYERKLHMYVVYCQNKPMSEHIVSENLGYFDQIRQKLKHRLDLSDLLIKPVQRITKYELLLKEIAKQTERAGLVHEVASMKEAFGVMKVVCKSVNDMMDVGRLQKFEGKITAQGMLLMHGPLICVEQTSNPERTGNIVQKPRELQVFLFDQSIIFSEIVGKKTQFSSPSYLYRSHIQVNKMQLEEKPNDKFLLKSTDPQRAEPISFLCTSATPEQNREWLKRIRDILQKQHDFLKAIQSPIAYQKELTKES